MARKLDLKLLDFERLARQANWPDAMVTYGLVKIREGHENYDEGEKQNIAFETLSEAVDIGGWLSLEYGNCAWVNFPWRFKLCVWLAGIIGRLIITEAKRRGDFHV